MARNDRIPHGIRKAANRLSAGRYMDPKTKRIYIDSADMDDAFEEMIDDTANADAKRIEEYERLRKLPRPPPGLQDLANDHVRRHAERMLQRVEDSSWGERASKRRDFLLSKRAFKLSVASDLDDEEKQELKDLDEALTAVKKNETKPEDDSVRDPKSS